MSATPSASYRLTIRARYANKVGNLAKVTSAIAEAGASIDSIDMVQVGGLEVTREITVDTGSEKQGQEVVQAVKAIPGVEILNVSDRTISMHEGGKIEVVAKSPLKTRDDLSMAYTPGVARISNAIAEDRSLARKLTIKRNTVAVVSDGSAVLGLGNVGPEAAMPVMEGKAMLFKEFGGVDAFPICISTQDTEEIIRTVKLLEPTFGGINLEDISAPRCFEIEDRLRAEMNIPVFHDDQHGTAAVVMAALMNAAKIIGKEISDMRAVISGAGAAGTACAKGLLAMGVGDVVITDTKGCICSTRTENMNSAKRWLADNTNCDCINGTLSDALAGADVFIGVSVPGVIGPEDLQTMAPDPIVFALSNPTPEILPEVAAPYVRVMATGRSDYPNQINNVLCFPGLFRGLLDCGSTTVNEEMIVAASKAIASVVSDEELTEDYIIPSVFDRRVAPEVARAVARVAKINGLAKVETEEKIVASC